MIPLNEVSSAEVTLLAILSENMVLQLNITVTLILI